MTNHAQIKSNLARAICEDDAVRDFCVEKFGRGALVIVDWYGAQGVPGVKEAPFVFIYSADENDAGFVDEETFTVHVVCGGVSGSDKPERSVHESRTATTNGIVVNGISAEMEELRNLVEAVVVRGGLGAVARTFTRVESSTAEWPLEWAKLNVEFFEPSTM